MSQPDAMLVYVHDPMCSWCWGFAPTLARLRERLPPEIGFRRLLGGLAPDSDQPMPEALQAQLQATWRRIAERIPGTRFNHDFWTRCRPRRSTWPACRAVIAARSLDPTSEAPMIRAIQEAYYLQARNPSEDAVLVALARELGLPADAFAQRLNAPQTQQALAAEIAETQRLGVTGFPSLILETGPASRWPIAVDYTDAEAMLRTIAEICAAT